jgi:hypothetical protein
VPDVTVAGVEAGVDVFAATGAGVRTPVVQRVKAFDGKVAALADTAFDEERAG